MGNKHKQSEIYEKETQMKKETYFEVQETHALKISNGFGIGDNSNFLFFENKNLIVLPAIVGNKIHLQIYSVEKRELIQSLEICELQNNNYFENLKLFDCSEENKIYIFSRRNQRIYICSFNLQDQMLILDSIINNEEIKGNHSIHNCFVIDKINLILFSVVENDYHGPSIALDYEPTKYLTIYNQEFRKTKNIGNFESFSFQQFKNDEFELLIMSTSHGIFALELNEFLLHKSKFREYNNFESISINHDKVAVSSGNNIYVFSLNLTKDSLKSGSFLEILSTFKADTFSSIKVIGFFDENHIFYCIYNKLIIASAKGQEQIIQIKDFNKIDDVKHSKAKKSLYCYGSNEGEIKEIMILIN